VAQIPRSPGAGRLCDLAGDEVGVAVAADTEQIAEQALRLVEIEWEAVAVRARSARGDAAWRARSPSADRGAQRASPDPVGGPDVFLSKGNVEQAFATADVVIEMDTGHHNPTQGSLDPGVASPNGKLAG